MTEKACENHLVDIAWQRCRRRIGQHRIRTDGNCRFDALLARSLHILIIFRTVLMDMPVHPRRLAVVFLQAIHADVALSRRRILRKDKGKRHKRAAILRPTGEDGNIIERCIVCMHDFLAGRTLDILRKIDRILELWNHRDDAHLILKRNVRKLQNRTEFICDIIELFNTECHCHALVAAKGIHENGHLGTLDLLKENRDVLFARLL